MTVDVVGGRGDNHQARCSCGYTSGWYADPLHAALFADHHELTTGHPWTQRGDAQ